MGIKDIITVPNETLKKISDPIEKVGINEKRLINDLFETMYNSNGIGLAAVQIGVLKRILVIDISSKDEKKNPLCFINPRIKNISDISIDHSLIEPDSKTGQIAINKKTMKKSIPKLLLFSLFFISNY